jgi:exopolysaccharide biosynthesis polyprenyl glycosylphosphotransferase
MRYYLNHVHLRSVALACLLDAVALFLAGGAAWGLRAVGAIPEPRLAAPTLLVIALPALLFYVQGYALPRLGDPERSARSVLEVGTAALVLLAVIGAAGWLPEGNVRAALVILGFGVSGLTAARWSFPRILARTRSTRRILLMGGDELVTRIAHQLAATSSIGLEVVGILRPRSEPARGWVAGIPVLGTVDDLPAARRRGPVDHIVLACDRLSEQGRAALLEAWTAGIPVESGLAFYERLFGRLYMRSVGPQLFALEAQLSARRPGDWLKRSLDVVGAALGLALGAPLVALAALAIALESPGPVFFHQARLGFRGRVFRLHKLRTMVVGAERAGAAWARRDDARVTRVGRFLRRTRIDEIPQLWNVLRGEMSLVGPRPERPEFGDELAARYPYFRLRLMVKPGLSGWAQTRQGYVNDVAGWENKLELDLYYVKNRSLLMDAVIVLQTVRTLLTMKGI